MLETYKMIFRILRPDRFARYEIVNKCVISLIRYFFLDKIETNELIGKNRLRLVTRLNDIAKGSKSKKGKSLKIMFFLMGVIKHQKWISQIV